MGQLETLSVSFLSVIRCLFEFRTNRGFQVFCYSVLTNAKKKEKGSTLDELVQSSIPLAPVDRARVIEKTPELATAHKDAASQGDTSAPDAEDNVDLHYVCFVKGTDGALYELDGRRRGPIKRGELADDEDVLSSKGLSMGALRFLEREGADLRFSAVALAGTLD
jgi:ubiquitin carboxyl-terminal hydrolase L3